MPARDYQLWAAQSIWNYFAKHNGNPLILMPTASGKSHVIAEFLQSVLLHYPTQRIQCLTHVKELIGQNYSKLLAAWPNAPAGIYSAGLNRKDIFQPIIFGGIASVAKKAALFGHVDLVIIDEAHLVNPTEETMYNKYIAALKTINPYLKVIGLTATGYRLGHGRITDGGLFTDVCFDMTSIQAFNWLIEQGYLVPLIPKPTKVELDVSGVHMRGGEYIAGELQNAVDKHDITIRALDEALARGKDRRKWLIFAAGVDHALHIAEQLNRMGVPAGAVHSKMSNAERDKILSDHKAGRIRAIANNNILTTGYDDPEIDLILCLRPTASTVLWVQMMGRGTRTVFAPGYDLSTQQGRLAAIAAGPKQNCLVLDYAGNTRKLGPINDPVIPRKKGEGSGGLAPVKLCDACDTYNHASVRFCIFCGKEFSFAVKIKQEASTAAIIKGDLPQVATFKVDQITYQRYERPGKPPMIRVSYYSGLRRFDEYVCLEHINFAGKKARDWWRKRSVLGPPETVDLGLQYADRLQTPSHIRVWVNKPYPEVMDADFTGTAFGTQEAILDSAWPVTHVHSAPKSQVDDVPDITRTTVDAYMDDDIPF
jgi:DNA repair protein RadD